MPTLRACLVLVVFPVLVYSSRQIPHNDLSRGKIPDELVPEVYDFLNRLKYFEDDDLYEALDQTELSEPCKSDVNYTLKNYFKTGWGLKMFDSNGKLPVGVLEGSFIIFGHYDECVRLDEPTGRFRGQHCMADITVSINSSLLSMTFPFFYGVCVPSTCKAIDVELALKAVTKRLMLPAVVSVDSDNCRQRGLEEPSPGAWAVLGVIAAFLVTAIASTVYDVYQRFKKKNKKPHELWCSFSFYTNGKYLLSTTKDPSMMTSLFGIRAITMGWVILGHSYLNTVYSPIINLTEVGVMNKDHTKVIIFNSFLSVDTFFLLSGMLVCFVFFRNIGKNKTFDQPMGYIHRYLRLTPAYGAMVAMEATLLNYIGNGPWWNRVHDASRHCQQYWWTTILYVQNYVNPTSVCLEHTWYLSADMQMYWVSPLVLYPMYLFPSLAVPYLGFLTLAMTFVDFAFVYVYDLPANFVVNPSPDRMRYEYYPFHTRMGPWLVGVALGYLIVGIRANKIKVNLSPIWITCGWVISFVLMTASMEAMDYFNQNPDYTALECAFFLAFHRLGWAIGLSWIIFACVNGFGGIVNNILSWTLFQPLAKISYCAYLLQFSVQRFRIGWLRTNTILADVDTIWLFLGDYVAANLISVLFFLLFEQPFLHLDRFFLKGVTIFNWPSPKPYMNKLVPKSDVEETPHPQEGDPKNVEALNQTKAELNEKL